MSSLASSLISEWSSSEIRPKLNTKSSTDHGSYTQAHNRVTKQNSLQQTSENHIDQLARFDPSRSFLADVNYQTVDFEADIDLGEDTFDRGFF